MPKTGATKSRAWAGDRVNIEPSDNLGPVFVQLLRDGDINAFVALGRLTQSRTGQARVIDAGHDTVVVVIRGTDRRFVVPADVVKSA